MKYIKSAKKKRGCVDIYYSRCYSKKNDRRKKNIRTPLYHHQYVLGGIENPMANGNKFASYDS